MRLVDFWHVMEKLGKATTLLFGSKEGSKHLGQWKLRLLNNPHAPAQILRELENTGREWEKAGEVTPVHDAITYLTNQADRMGYVAARAEGRNIGSGSVEATCKSLVQVRMCRSGARWRRHSAQAVLSLRALALSDRWDLAMQLTLGPLRHDVQCAA